MERFGIPGAIRASLAFYNTKEEIDKFIEAIKQVKRMLG
jgi:cysteine desulfurase/selenocysteine lyase